MQKWMRETEARRKGISMKLKNILIVVSDIDKAEDFYREMFGLQVIYRTRDNRILTDGLVLQSKSGWEAEFGEDEKQDEIERTSAPTWELYFEDYDLEDFAKKLEATYPNITVVTPLTTLEWGQKIMRIQDLDKNLIEIRTPISV